MALEPAKIFAGRVTYADTGKPVAHARWQISERGKGHPGNRPNDFETDADGRFRVNPSSGDRYVIRAMPPIGQLYLAASKSIEWPKGAIEQSVDLRFHGVPSSAAKLSRTALPKLLLAHWSTSGHSDAPAMIPTGSAML